MRKTEIMMGMPITVEIIDNEQAVIFDDVFDYFLAIDKRFSLYRPDSEISAFNDGSISLTDISQEMSLVFALAERTKCETGGYFDIRRPDGFVDPSGIVKGWAIRNAARLIRSFGSEHFFVDAGGDVQCVGKNAKGDEWRVGIRNPFNEQEIIKALIPRGQGVATSGTYVRGPHIYNPHRADEPIADVASLTVIGPDVLEADRFATAAFAMGKMGIHFIEKRQGLEGYVVDSKGNATQTSGFGAFVVS